jgi:hypothetical protein
MLSKTVVKYCKKTNDDVWPPMYSTSYQSGCFCLSGKSVA